jgi:sugar lactone lactonase YvrE
MEMPHVASAPHSSWKQFGMLLRISVRLPMKRTTLLLCILLGLLTVITLTVHYRSKDGATVIDTGDGPFPANGLLLFHPDGTTIGVASSGAIELWNVPTKQRIRRIAPDGGNYPTQHRAFAWSPDGTMLVTDTPSNTWCQCR